MFHNVDQSADNSDNFFSGIKLTSIDSAVEH